MLPLLLFALVPSLQAPWPCNENFVVSQGNNGGLSHSGFEQFAWDFDLDLGDPILAAAGGTIIRLRTDSTIGGCDSSFGNDANYVVIDHGDGSAGLYLHMAPHSSPLALGDVVQTGDLIGRVGLTGWVCGDHLHFQVQEICASWYCQSVAASFAGQGVPGQFDGVLSNNCPTCEASLDGATTTVESSDLACFAGLQPSWSDSPAGDAHHHFHTLARNSSTATGQWNFDVAQAGDYEVEVYVPPAEATATGATYVVHHAEGVDEVVVDQSGLSGWESLGVFPFSGPGQRVELSDDTNDDPAAGRRVAFDAVRFVYVPAAGESTGEGPATDGDTGDEPGSTSGAGTGFGSGQSEGGEAGMQPDGTGVTSGPSGDEAGGTATGGGGGQALPEWSNDGSAGGCACDSGGPKRGPSLPWFWFAMVGLGLRRRGAA